MFNWINKIISWLFKKQRKEESTSKVGNNFPSSQKSQKYYFSSILEKESTPDNDLIQENEFITVVFKNKPYWSLFRCPCGCGYVITLPHQKPQNPRWRMYESEFKRPTLYPSIWQNKGCYSHFWVEDGQIMWCENTGTEPYVDDN